MTLTIIGFIAVLIIAFSALFITIVACRRRHAFYVLIASVLAVVLDIWFLHDNMMSFGII